MRLLWAGLFVLFFTSGALAQANGYVRELGFEGNYRPDCWVPLLVHLESTASEPAEYQIQVHQQDLDQDTVVYTRTVTLGPKARDDVWVYFQPQPTAGGLPGGTSTNPLGDVLKVHLYDKAGRKHIANLPVQGSIKANSVDAGGGGVGSDRAIKIVLVVRETGNFHASEYGNAHGVMEDVLFVPVRLTQSGLPDHVLGYQMVDAVLWLDAKLNDIRNTPAFGALQQWVRQGGNLAVCHQTDRSQLEALIAADMLPVVGKVSSASDAAWAIQIRQKKDLDHIISILRQTSLALLFNEAAWKAVIAANPFFEVAYAQPRPDAMVDGWIYWSDPGQPEDRSPFIARRAYGMGSVTWVAQELGSGVLSEAPDPSDKPATQPSGSTQPARPRRMMVTNGWPRLWDKVFGWRNQTRTNGEMEEFKAVNKGDAGQANLELFANQYTRGGGVDVGRTLINGGTEHSARSTAYVFLAVLFFIVYWVIAGPGSYVYLASKKKKGLSWTVFGATALAATLLTVILVKLLLQGGPEARHVTLVRLTPDQPAADGTARYAANMHTRMGLYIPRDGEQVVSVADPGPDRTASVSPYAVHPQWLKDEKDSGFTDTAKYFVNTDPILAGKAASVGFPYRSTLKKVDARWAGPVTEGISGSVRMTPAGLAGTLTNKLGHDVRNIFLVFTIGWIDSNQSRTSANDVMLYIPTWKNGAVIDVAAEAGKAKVIDGMQGASPGSGVNVIDRLEPSTTRNWSRYLLGDLSGAFGNEVFDKGEAGILRTFPLMSLIDRVGPVRREKDNSDTRAEPIRRGGRDFNASQLVASGRLVMLAQAVDVPVPLPMQVNGDGFESRGTVLFQVSLPVDRSPVRPLTPSTAPATQPQSTTVPASRPESNR